MFSVHRHITQGLTTIVDDPDGKHSTIDAAFLEAVSGDTGGTIRFLASGEFAAGVTVSRPGLIIEIPRRITLTNATSGTNGMFKFTGDRITLRGGGKISIPDGNWVDDQVVVEFSSCDQILVDNVVFQAGKDATLASTGDVGGILTDQDTSNPMTMLKFTTCSNKVVRHSFFYPGQAVQMIHSSHGNGLVVDGCHFTTESDEGFDVGDLLLVNPRHAYRCIHAENDEWGKIINNRFWALGDKAGTVLGTASEVEFALRLVGEGSGGNREEGHWIISGNHCEGVSSPKPFQLWGILSCIFTSNLIGFSGIAAASPAEDAAGDGHLIITGHDGTATGNKCSDIQVIANNIHNPGKTGQSACAIFLEATENISILSNAFSALTNIPVIRVDPDTTGETSVIGNTFFAAASVAGRPVEFLSGTFAANNTLVYANNRKHNLTGADVDTSTNSPTITGNIRAAGDVVSYAATTISAANSDNSINDSASGFPELYEGDLISISGFTGTAANNRICEVVSRTTAKIIVTSLGNDAAFVDDAAGETVTVRRLSANTNFSTT